MKNLRLLSSLALPLLSATQLLTACATSKSTNAAAPAASSPLGVQSVQASQPGVSQSSAIEPTGPTESKPQPQQYSPGQLVDALHTTFGTHRARAVHAKGIILLGVFTPDAGAKTLTTAAHLQDTKSTVTVRFSDFTGLPDIPDNSPSANPRGLSVKFAMPGGLTTDIVAHSFNGFPTATSDDFHDLLLSIAASGAEAAKPNALDRFLSLHPVAKTFLTTQKTPASYAAITYFGVNSFELTNAHGESRFVRYQFVPEGGEQLLTADEAAHQSAGYLASEIRTRVGKHPFRFAFVAQLAEPGDKIADPSIAWPDTRTRVPLGTLEIRTMAPNTASEDRALSFSPDNLPDGIKPADPMVTFRSRAYPISVKERQ